MFHTQPVVCARCARSCAHARMHEHAGGTAADLADFADISLALAAPLTFSWCQINLDLARCHIHLGTHLQTRDLQARLQKHGHA